MLVYFRFSWIMKQAVSFYSHLFACMTSLIVDGEQDHTHAAVLWLSALIVSHHDMPASVRPLSQWRVLMETSFVIIAS